MRLPQAPAIGAGLSTTSPPTAHLITLRAFRFYPLPKPVYSFLVT
jgi:hypothetical protein